MKWIYARDGKSKACMAIVHLNRLLDEHEAAN